MIQAAAEAAPGRALLENDIGWCRSYREVHQAARKGKEAEILAPRKRTLEFWPPEVLQTILFCFRFQGCGEEA